MFQFIFVIISYYPEQSNLLIFINYLSIYINYLTIFQQEFYLIFHLIFQFKEQIFFVLNSLKRSKLSEVEQSLDISEFEYESCQFCSDSKKEDYYTTNNTNRFPIQDSKFVDNHDNTVKIQYQKIDYENLKRDALCYQFLVQNNQELKRLIWLVNSTKSYR